MIRTRMLMSLATLMLAYGETNKTGIQANPKGKRKQYQGIPKDKLAKPPSTIRANI